MLRTEVYSFCLLQEAPSNLWRRQGVLSMEGTYTKHSGALGEEETHSSVVLFEEECVTLTLRGGHGCDSLGWQEPREEGRTGPRHGVRRMQ